MVPTWSAFLVHYFLHSNKHNLLSSQCRTPSIVVVVLSLEARVLSPFFSIWAHVYVEWVLCLVNCAYYVSRRRLRLLLILAFVLHTLGSMPAPHHRFMLTCLANIHAQDARPEMNMLSKKRLFFILVSRFYSNLFELFYRCPTVVRVNHSTWTFYGHF